MSSAHPSHRKKLISIGSANGTTELNEATSQAFFYQDYFIPVKVAETLFILNMNRGQKYNILSKEYMDAMRRYIIHYESNSTLKSAVLRCFDSKIFSLGTDFKRLSALTDQGDIPEIRDYLQVFVKFAEYMAQTSFPLLVNTSGQLANSAASIFTSLPFVYDNGDTRLKFNDIDFQSIPLGSTFTLSRLPNALGVYLALTGNTIQGGDLKEFKFVKDYITLEGPNLDYIKNNSARNYEVHEYDVAYRPMFRYNLSQKADTNQTIEEFFDRSQNENGKQVLFDLYYRKKLIESANYSMKERMQDPEDWIHYKEEYYNDFENFIYCFEADVLEAIPLRNKTPPSQYNEAVLDFISRVFSKGSLQEIYQALDNETEDFAKTIRSQLENKNQLVLSLTLRMINEAINLSFNECMIMECETLLAMSQHKAIRDFVFKPYSGAFPSSQLLEAEEIATQVLKVYSEDPNAFGLTKSALLPTKNYYKRFPEAFRCYFNNQSLRNPLLEKNFKNVVKSTLLRYGIDPMNPTFDKEYIGNKLRLYFDWYRKFQVKNERILELARDPLKTEEYVLGREKAITEFVNSSDFAQRIEAIIEQVFKDEIETNENVATEKSAQAQLILKKILVQQLKDFVLVNRLTESEYESNLKELLKNLPLEIEQNRFSLNTKTKAKIDFDNLKEKFQKTVNIRSAEDLKDALKNGLTDFSQYTQLEKLSNDEIVLNTTNIFQSRDRSAFKLYEMDMRDNEFMAHNLFYRGMPKTEKSYRRHFIQSVLRSIKQNSPDLTPEDKKEIIQFINHKYFKEIEERHNFDEIILMSKETFIDYCKEIQPSYETIELINTGERKNLGSRNVSISIEERNNDREIANTIRNLNSIDLSSNQKNKSEMTITSSMEDMVSLLMDTDILSSEQKAFIQKLTEKNSSGLFEDILTSMHEIYSAKFYELFGDKPVTFKLNQTKTRFSSIFQDHFMKESQQEFLAFIGPHLFYNISLQTLDLIEKLHIALEYALSDTRYRTKDRETTYARISSLLSDFKVNVKNEQEFDQFMDDLDQMTNVMVDFNNEYKSKIFFKEDLLREAIENAREVLRLKLLLTAKAVKRFRDPRFVTQPSTSNLFKVTPEQARTRLIELVNRLQNVFPYPEKDENKEEIEDEENEESSVEVNAFEHALVEDLNSTSNLDTFTSKLVEYFDLVNESKFSYGFKEVEKGINIEDPKSIGNGKMPDFLVSGDANDELGKFWKGFINILRKFSPDLESKFTSIYNCTRQNRLQRILMTTAKMRSRLFTQVYTHYAGNDFERKVRPSFLQKYYESHQFNKDLAEEVKSKRPGYLGNPETKPITGKFGVMEPGAFSSLNFGDRTLISGSYEALLDLERQGKKLMHGGEPSGLDDLYQKITKETVEIPKAFTEMDFRQNPKDWVEFQIYLYLRIIFNLRKQIEKKQNNLELKLSDYDFIQLLTPEKIQTHLRDKLYHELITLENINFTVTDYHNSFEERYASAGRTSPDLLDPERVLKHEHTIKKYLAFESFAFKDRGQNDTEILRNIRYLISMTDEFDQDTSATQTPAEQKEQPTDSAAKKPEKEMTNDRMYAEIFKVLSDNEANKIEAIKKNLSETIHTVAKRISLYK